MLLDFSCDNCKKVFECEVGKCPKCTSEKIRPLGDWMGLAALLTIAFLLGGGFFTIIRGIF